MNDHRAAQVKHLGIDVLRTKGDAPIALFGVDWMRPGEDAAYHETYHNQWIGSVPGVSSSRVRSSPNTGRM